MINSNRRWAAFTATAALLAEVVFSGPVLAAAEPTTVDPPSVTVQTPDTDNCQAKDAPTSAQDTSENVPVGSTQPRPMPVPQRAVGGARLGECGFAVPKGTPPLPSDISAASWLIADLDTGDVLAAKDAHGRYRPASTLKLLSINVFLRNLRELDQVVIGTDEDTTAEGTRVGIGPGGRYTVRQLMTFLLLGSGNDVASALARANGGAAKTIQQMNARAAELGAFDTRAATVSGLDGAGQQTSAYDLALIAKADMGIKPFPGLVATEYAKVPGYGEHEAFSIANDNDLLFSYPGALGGKTGFTDSAGNTYVGMAERDGRRLVVTMLAGTQEPRSQWMQAASLLDWGFALPVGTTPVGRLVRSGAEAIAVPEAASTAPEPTRSTLTLGGARTSSRATVAVTTAAAPASQPAAAAVASSGEWNILLWIAVAIGILLAGVAVFMGLRGSGRDH